MTDVLTEIETHPRGSGGRPVLPAPAAHPDDDRLLTFEPRRASPRRMLADLWLSRELLYFLIWRDIKVRYKQTWLGALWAIIQPVMSMIVLSIFFGRMAGMSREMRGVPYPIFLYSGLLPWTFFANSISTGANAVVSNASLVTKIRFPRIALPIASVAVGLVDFSISFTVLLVMMAWYRVPITWNVLLAPPLLLAVALAALGCGSVLAALTVSYRDFRYVVPFLVQIWMYATPVIYPVRAVPGRWRWLLSLNPVSGLIGGCRTAFLGQPLDLHLLVFSLVSTGVIIVGALYYFNSVESRFADII